mmetsp:Transcript_802/g.2620  ORF Transcript_802/g.2620 Transcript_802/m.2620 type:complete len:478 (+) Transcript_802:184-1617(+)
MSEAGSHFAQTEVESSGPPPGFEEVCAGTHSDSISELTTTVAGVTVDVRGISAELREEPVETEIVTDTPYTSAATFEELHLTRELLDGLYNEMKFERPSQIQAKTLPLIVLPPHRHLIAQAHNGSGKTTCFVLGMLSRIDVSVRAPQAICICPVRELVIQNQQVLEKMAKYTGISYCTTASDDDKSVARHKSREKITNHVIIGTPGKLKNWTLKKLLQLRMIKILVFDEADQMFEANGFREDSALLMGRVLGDSPSCQVLLFSATFSSAVKQFAQKLVHNANQVFLEKEKLSLDKIKQYQVSVESHEAKVKLMKDTIFPSCEKLGQTIIFVRAKKTARELNNTLRDVSFPVSCIEGDMDFADRDRCIQAFRDGRTKILIATDVLSRGFDHSSVTLVINFDMPVQHNAPNIPAFETYMHRVGRTGRFGRRGIAFNLILGQEEKRICGAIEAHFDHSISTINASDEESFEQVLLEAGLG